MQFQKTRKSLLNIFFSFPLTLFFSQALLPSFLPSLATFFTRAGLEYPFLFFTHHRKERERESEKKLVVRREDPRKCPRLRKEKKMKRDR